jgi:hypothetical protein
VVLIPNWAIRTDPTSRELFTYWYCVDGEQQPQRVVITLGERNESFTQVLEGLDAGAIVALVTEERLNLLELTGPPSGMR